MELLELWLSLPEVDVVRIKTERTTGWSSREAYADAAEIENILKRVLNQPIIKVGKNQESLMS